MRAGGVFHQRRHETLGCVGESNASPSGAAQRKERCLRGRGHAVAEALYFRGCRGRLRTASSRGDFTTMGRTLEGRRSRVSLGDRDTVADELAALLASLMTTNTPRCSGMAIFHEVPHGAGRPRGATNSLTASQPPWKLPTFPQRRRRPQAGTIAAALRRPYPTCDARGSDHPVVVSQKPILTSYLSDPPNQTVVPDLTVLPRRDALQLSWTLATLKTRLPWQRLFTRGYVIGCCSCPPRTW